MVDNHKANSLNEARNLKIPPNPKAATTPGKTKVAIPDSNKTAETKTPYSLKFIEKWIKAARYIKKSYWLTFIRKWIIVIATVYMALYTAKLFRLTTQQSKDASAQADSSYALSKRIAASQEKFAKIETRAYIAIKSVFVYPPHPDSLKNGYAIYENIGKTPANNCRHWMETGLYAGTLKREAIEKLIIEPKLGSSVGANTPVTLFISKERRYKFTKADCDSINNGLLKLYILGAVFYDDVYNEHHHTHFLGVYDPKTAQTIRNNLYGDAN